MNIATRNIGEIEDVIVSQVKRGQARANRMLRKNESSKTKGKTRKRMGRSCAIGPTLFIEDM